MFSYHCLGSGRNGENIIPSCDYSVIEGTWWTTAGGQISSFKLSKITYITFVSKLKE
jgi:hypothetical protein